MKFFIVNRKSFLKLVRLFQRPVIHTGSLNPENRELRVTADSETSVL